MSNTRETKDAKEQLSVRIPPKLIEQIDAFAAKTADDLGTDISRASAVEMLLRSGLNLRANARTR